MSDPIKAQQAFCAKKEMTCVPSSLDSKLGFAIQTQGELPINGLRHAPTGDTNGWYVWCGETLSDDPEFFAPLHTAHLADIYPEIIQLLGLPPGRRFLVAEGYEDIWFDESLLKVD